MKTIEEKPEILIGSVWHHKNGNQYRVLLIVNTKTDFPKKYPVTVVYENTHNFTKWSRPLSDWHRSMKLMKKGF